MILESSYRRGTFMNKHDGFDYYVAFARQAEYALEMVMNLKSAIDAGELGSRELMDALHTVENDADKVNHDIQSHLLADFVVPLERGGMCRLAHALDDVSDSVEEVAIRAYCYGVTSLSSSGKRMIDMLSEAADELRQAMAAFSAKSRKDAAVRNHLVRVQTLESECDEVYIDGVHELYATEGADPERRYIDKSILASLEKAMDTMENAAESVEAVVEENA